jgi:hypothetical protein
MFAEPSWTPSRASDNFTHVSKTAEVHASDDAVRTREDDLLGRWPLATRIYETIRLNPVDQPLRIAIYGKWGEGKTSVANLVSNIARANGDIVFNFCPWGSRNSGNLWSRFLVDLYSVLGESGVALPEDLSFKSYKGGAVLEKIKGAVRELSGEGGAIQEKFGINLSNIDILARFMTTFSDDTSTVLRKLGKRVIVVVDDLDRTDPAIVPDILYAFSEVLQVPHLVFILCLDPTMVAAALEKGNRGWRNPGFLEKIIDIPFWLSRPSPHALYELAHKYIVEDTGIVSDQVFREDIWPLLPRTPRSVKRLARQLMTAKPEVDRGGITDIANMVRIELFRHEFPELHDLLDVEGTTETQMSLNDFSTGGSVSETEPKSLVIQISERGVSDPQRLQYAVRLLEVLGYTKECPGISDDARSTMNAIDHPPPITSQELSAFVSEAVNISEGLVGEWIGEIQKQRNEVPSRILESMFRSAIDSRERCIWQKHGGYRGDELTPEPSAVISKYLQLIRALVDIDLREMGEPIFQTKDLRYLMEHLQRYSDDRDSESSLVCELFERSKSRITDLYEVLCATRVGTLEPEYDGLLESRIRSILETRTLAEIEKRLTNPGRLCDFLFREPMSSLMRRELLNGGAGMLVNGRIEQIIENASSKDHVAIAHLVSFVVGVVGDPVYSSFPYDAARSLWELAKPKLEFSPGVVDSRVAYFERRLTEIKAFTRHDRENEPEPDDMVPDV